MDWLIGLAVVALLLLAALVAAWWWPRSRTQPARVAASAARAGHATPPAAGAASASAQAVARAASPPDGVPTEARPQAAQAAQAAQASVVAPADLGPGAAAPPPLSGLPEWPAFTPLRAADLPPPRRRQLLDRHVSVPRPSRLLDQLLSSEFINQASPRQLAELVAGEPLLAARVLRAVNSPFYGLPQPVTSIVQAVTYLGLTTVRITCLRYIFIAAFKTTDLRRQQAIDRLWLAGSLASDLMHRAAPALQLHDAGRWASAVLLSFLGRLAVVASAPAEHLAALSDSDPVLRVAAEQDVLGLCAAELGRLLMSDWGLPAAVVDDAADIEWLLFGPPPGTAPQPGVDERNAALAVCALCVRLGERVARTPAGAWPGLDFLTDPAHEIACLRLRLGERRLGAVQPWLDSAAVLQILQRSAPP